MTNPNEPRRGSAALWIGILVAVLVIGVLAWSFLNGRQEPVSPEPIPGNEAQAPAPAPSYGERLQAAVAAAFPQGPTAPGEDGEPYTFSNHRLIDAPFGPVLVSEGKAQDAAHVTPGRIDITYLKPAGTGFAVAKSYPAAVQAGSFGQMSEWSVSDRFAEVPTIDAEGGFTGQGYTCAVAVLTELRPSGPVEVGQVQTVYDDSGAEPNRPQSIEGKFANIERNKGFDVRYTGSKSFTEHYALSGGKYVRQGASQLPEC